MFLAPHTYSIGSSNVPNVHLPSKVINLQKRIILLWSFPISLMSLFNMITDSRHFLQSPLNQICLFRECVSFANGCDSLNALAIYSSISFSWRTRVLAKSRVSYTIFSSPHFTLSLITQRNEIAGRNERETDHWHPPSQPVSLILPLHYFVILTPLAGHRPKGTE